MRNAWYPVFVSEEVSAGHVHPTNLFGDPIVVFRDGEGRPSCFLDSCPHRSIPFSLGSVTRGRLECAYHGWQYEGDGRCVHMPFLPEGKSIPRSAVARTYPTLERNGLVWVWPGDPSRADAALLPIPFPACAGHPQTHTITTRFESRYDLVIDHGLDMPHFFQLHARTLIRYNPPLKAGFPTLDGIEEDESSLTMKWRLRGRGGKAFLITQAFHPCSIFTDLPLDSEGKLSIKHLVFFTPIDEKHTRGFLFTYRNFLTMPVVGHVVDKAYAWVMARGRTEDDAIFAGQLANELMGAKSTTAWSHDVVTTRYNKWQSRRSSEDMWFKDLDHARRRYQGEDVG